jgi:hypothetical protein
LWTKRLNEFSYGAHFVVCGFPFTGFLDVLRLAGGVCAHDPNAIV